MKFSIRLTESESAASHRHEDIDCVSGLLGDHVKDMSYGPDVLEYMMWVIVIKTRPGYETWHQPRRAKYIQDQHQVNTYNGETVHVKGRLVHEFRIDHEEFDFFVHADRDRSRSFLANKVVQQIEQLKLPGKIKNFDRQKLKEDILECMGREGLIGR